MPEKKNNHIIPRCLIRQWCTEEKGLSGVHVYEIFKKKISFSTSKGKRAFSFAIEPYFYVPAINDERIYKVENWLGAVEGTLAKFLRQLNEEHDGTLLESKEEFTKLLLALFSLKNRAKFDIRKISEFASKNPKMKDLILNEDNTNLEIGVLENLINVTTEEAIEYSNCELIICKVKEGNILLSDRPFLHKLLDGYSFVALSPYYFIALRKTKHEPEYYYTNAIGADMIHTYNQITAENSRDWIVSTNGKQLQKYIPYATTLKKESEPYSQSVKFLKHGYKII